MAITDAWLRATVNKPYKGKPEVTHRDGLGVRVSPKGKVTWIYRVLFRSKPIKLTLGQYPALKMREAIVLKDKKAELVMMGVDPRVGLNLSQTNVPTTINEIIDYWLENHAKDNILRWKPLIQMFDTDIRPYIGEYQAKHLELIDYMPVFRKARERVSPKHSANLMARFKQVLSFAVRHGLIKYNALSELKKTDVGVQSSVKKSKQSEEAVPVLWNAISEIHVHESNCNFLRLMMIFACRSNELRLAKKSDFDLDKLIWTVPEENNKTRKKNGGEIIRPIPKLAEEVIRFQMGIWQDHKIMFPPVISEDDRPMSANVPVAFGRTLADKIESMGYPRTTNHDMRRTARNIWESIGIKYHVAEVMLGHKVHTGVQSHYLDYNYLEEQREGYELWCGVIYKDIHG